MLYLILLIIAFVFLLRCRLPYAPVTPPYLPAGHHHQHTTASEQHFVAQKFFLSGFIIEYNYLYHHNTSVFSKLCTECVSQLDAQTWRSSFVMNTSAIILVCSIGQIERKGWSWWSCFSLRWFCFVTGWCACIIPSRQKFHLIF